MHSHSFFSIEIRLSLHKVQNSFCVQVSQKKWQSWHFYKVTSKNLLTVKWSVQVKQLASKGPLQVKHSLSQGVHTPPPVMKKWLVGHPQEPSSFNSRGYKQLTQSFGEGPMQVPHDSSQVKSQISKKYKPKPVAVLENALSNSTCKGTKLV